MGLQSEDTSGGGQPAAETEAHARTADESTTTFRLLSSSAGRDDDDMDPDDDMDADDDMVRDDDMVPGDAGPEARTEAEPAEPWAEKETGNYAAFDDADEPAEDPAADDADEPAGVATNALLDEAARLDEAPAEREAWAAAVADPATDPATAAPAAIGAPASPGAPTASVGLAGLDQPLLSGDPELLARWQRAQLGFIDDPRAAVAGAADIVEQAGRALVEALEQRQRQMRTMWDHSPSEGPGVSAGSNADTEQLRQMMRRYQSLFNQLSQPA
jgi:hypothetical protein